MNKLDELRRNWDDLAQINPMWAICSDPDKLYGKWEINQFFEIGKHEINQIIKLLCSLNIKISFNTALDFGCGIGRLTQALRAKFNVVYGLDISVKMIELASHLNLYEIKYIVN